MVPFPIPSDSLAHGPVQESSGFGPLFLGHHLYHDPRPGKPLLQLELQVRPLGIAQNLTVGSSLSGIHEFSLLRLVLGPHLTCASFLLRLTYELLILLLDVHFVMMKENPANAESKSATKNISTVDTMFPLWTKFRSFLLFITHFQRQKITLCHI